MKKSLLIFGCALAMFSCNKEGGEASGFKTAYVDTSKLSKDYEEFKDLESQSKVKMEEMGRELDGKVNQWKLDAASFQEEAKVKGPQWAQLKGQELQKREQELNMLQQGMMKQLQDEFGVKNDSAVSKMKKLIRDYGKKKGYDYVYGTGDATNTILYAKDSYDITNDVLKELNSTYKGGTKSEDTPKKEEVKK
ncbi:OmpH family outer membrane protein [Flavobacterium sp.]|uniref:OmpH family outer membrane protein n=1 Tax=Flavobacterium sp. TaxID=239 RepID=UPI004034C6AF